MVRCGEPPGEAVCELQPVEIEQGFSNSATAIITGQRKLQIADTHSPEWSRLWKFRAA